MSQVLTLTNVATSFVSPATAPESLSTLASVATKYATTREGLLV
jgi:hypothetical protein